MVTTRGFIRIAICASCAPAAPASPRVDPSLDGSRDLGSQRLPTTKNTKATKRGRFFFPSFVTFVVRRTTGRVASRTANCRRLTAEAFDVGQARGGGSDLVERGEQGSGRIPGPFEELLARCRREAGGVRLPMEQHHHLLE